MSELEGMTWHGMTCDAANCPQEIRGEPRPGNEGRTYYIDVAFRRGWTLWVGRSRRTYCPDHGPRPGHTMRQVTN